MATTTSSKTFCFRTNRKLRFLRLLPFILLAILVISAVVFSVKVHKRLTRLSNQTQDLYQRDNSIHTLDVRLIHLADQIESLKHAQSKLESAHAVEIYSIQQSYHRDVERMRLTLKQYETAMEKLSERYALLEQANLELSLKMDLMQRRTSEALMEAKMQVEKVRDPVAMKKEMESIFESFLQKEILSLLNTRDSEKQKEDLQKETPKKGRRVNEKHYDRSVHHDEERLEVEKLNTRDPFYFDENEEVNKSQENYSSPIHDFIDTSYRFAKKGFETAKDYVYVHPRDDKKKIVIEVINEVNPSDPFYFDENEEANRSQENYSSPIDDLIDTSYRFTKQGFETVKGYVKENGPKIVEKVEKVSKQNFEKVKDYVSETIPKVSAKLDDLGKKTQEFTEKTRRKMEAEAEKLAIKAKKAAKSIFDMVRN